jgi:hypothetical protein
MPNCPDCGQALTAVDGSTVWFKCTTETCLVKRVRYDPAPTSASNPAQINRASGTPKVDEF